MAPCDSTATTDLGEDVAADAGPVAPQRPDATVAPVAKAFLRSMTPVGMWGSGLQTWSRGAKAVVTDKKDSKQITNSDLKDLMSV